MNRLILLLVAVLVGLSANADYTVTTNQPLYPTPVGSYSIAQQPYMQQYNQGYYQNPYQNQYQGQYINPYQVGYQQQYANPYQYQMPYGYRSNSPYSVINSAISGLGATNGTQGIVKNIGQSILYSMVRGY